MKVAVEAVPTIEIDVLPSERRHALQPVDRALVALDFQRAEQFRQDDVELHRNMTLRLQLKVDHLLWGQDIEGQALPAQPGGSC